MGDVVSAFSDLHISGNPLILFNIWDAGSAQAVGRAGAKALATGSWSVAGAHGMGDGEALPFDLAIANLERITLATNLPVSMDMEAGYADSAEGVARNANEIADAGGVGVNIEDQIPGAGKLYDAHEQAERIAAAAQSGLFINARCDHFIMTDPDEHNAALLDKLLERAAVYQKAGANGLFVPMLGDPALIKKLCAQTDLPVNIMRADHVPDNDALATLGVARISYGPGPWMQAMQWLEEQAKREIAE